MTSILSRAQANAHWRNTPEDRAIAAKLGAAEELARRVDARMNDLGGYDDRFSVRAALAAYHAAGETP
jgi:hypothetical protein